MKSRLLSVIVSTLVLSHVHLSPLFADTVYEDAVPIVKVKLTRQVIINGIPTKESVDGFLKFDSEKITLKEFDDYSKVAVHVRKELCSKELKGKASFHTGQVFVTEVHNFGLPSKSPIDPSSIEIEGPIKITHVEYHAVSKATRLSGGDYYHTGKIDCEKQ